MNYQLLLLNRLYETVIDENALGLPIHNTKEGVENFWQWFDNSVMKNKKGKPCVFYHVSPFVFDKFIPVDIVGQLEGDKASFFSTNKNFAIEFGKERFDDVGGGAVNVLPGSVRSKDVNLYECYLRCKRPFNFRNQKCLNKFLNYISTMYPVQSARKDSREVANYKSLLTGKYPYNYIKDASINIGTIVNLNGDNSLPEEGKVVGFIEDEKIPNSIIQNSSLNNNVVVFRIGGKTALTFGLEILNKLDGDISIKNSFTEILKRIDDSQISLQGFKNRKIPFMLSLENHESQVRSNIVIRRISLSKRDAPIYNYDDNWEDIEHLLINDNVSFVSVIKSLGYDSFFTLESGVLNIAVFNSSDIKSINNNGEFSETGNIFQ